MEPPRKKYRLRKTSSEHSPWADAQTLQNWCVKKYEETGGSGKDPPLHLELQKTTTTGIGHN